MNWNFQEILTKGPSSAWGCDTSGNIPPCGVALRRTCRCTEFHRVKNANLPPPPQCVKSVVWYGAYVKGNKTKNKFQLLVPQDQSDCPMQTCWNTLINKCANIWLKFFYRFVIKDRRSSYFILNFWRRSADCFI